MDRGCLMHGQGLPYIGRIGRIERHAQQQPLPAGLNIPFVLNNQLRFSESDQSRQHEP